MKVYLDYDEDKLGRPASLLKVDPRREGEPVITMVRFWQFVRALEEGPLDGDIFQIELKIQVGGGTNFGLPKDFYMVELRKRGQGAIIPMMFTTKFGDRSGLNQHGQNHVQYQSVNCLKEAKIANPIGQNESL